MSCIFRVFCCQTVAQVTKAAPFPPTSGVELATASHKYKHLYRFARCEEKFLVEVLWVERTSPYETSAFATLDYVGRPRASFTLGHYTQPLDTDKASTVRIREGLQVSPDSAAAPRKAKSRLFIISLELHETVLPNCDSHKVHVQPLPGQTEARENNIPSMVSMLRA